MSEDLLPPLRDVIARHGLAARKALGQNFLFVLYLSRLARVASDSGVKLVVDNLQSGPDIGKPLAQGFGARHVTLTNFPLQGSYGRSLLDNVAALSQAIE